MLQHKTALQRTACNVQARRHATDIQEKRQDATGLTMRNKTGCNVQHATRNTHTLQARRSNVESRQDATGRAAACNMQTKQVATLQHGPSACNMQHAKRTTNGGMQQTACSRRNRYIALQRAAYTTQHRRHATDIQHEKQTTCNSNVKHCNRRHCNLHKIDIMQPAACNMQHRQHCSRCATCPCNNATCSIATRNKRQQATQSGVRHAACNITQPVTLQRTSCSE